MQQLIIQIADKEKAQMLLKIISALDFVNSVEVIEDNSNISDNEQDFFHSSIFDDKQDFFHSSMNKNQ